METKKHIINIPKNKVAENISVKTENGQIVVNYDLKEKFSLKEGEIYYVETNTGNKFICIYKDIINHQFRSYASLYNLTNLYYTYNEINEDCHIRNIIYIREATVQEKESLLNALAEEGIQWNAENKCLEKYVWKPKEDEEYFFIGIDFKVYNNIYYDNYLDSLLISVGNCFQTEEQAEKKAKELKEVLKKK